MRKIRTSFIGLIFFDTTSTFALQQSLVKCSRCHLVWLYFRFLHFLVNLNEFFGLFASATRLKKPAINELNVSHWFYLVLHMIKQAPSKLDELGSVRAVDWQCGTEYLKPKKE